ncbi:OprD family outer membrane porin [Pseudomonas sp. 10B1]|uniref:OprD family outer membrane porin n=1 Tax=unclassified Pseudomonas TaxID=196821 RepID=UPI002AB4295B|nr:MULTISPECIES: OprD family outer membrane porin [unclassified Pseudomonas]MDY7562273.1 OprD family outer membrane porin [Pseudomonas sp. AB6]MEA9976307.1 OprD family outer membrane porin [Pseudomonas sp. RTS4]MEA9994804.1 OprD family outer membrane porin [Pseudomonas sp. AA4]MEB0086467.1 OprD family outer membrane porin [Pseudomonas sp. RTI1]MEB0126334.1 OprD family outer membrane porin [Pseudomonas sp. CCC1.2]
MLKLRIGMIALSVIGATQAMASGQDDSKGFVDDSSLNLALRNAYINRDYKDGQQDKAEWGQSVIANFASGFTQGTIGFGIDAFAEYALRLDGGKGRSGAGGIDFFKKDSNGNAADDLSKGGGAIKARFSNTVIKYGDQMPELPVLSYDNSRLLSESYTGTFITSKEINGLELNAGHFTAESRKSAEGRDSGGLKSINVYGGSYKFTDAFSAAFYGSNDEDVLKKQYINLNYVFAIEKDQSLTFDFNGYKTKLDRDFAVDNARDNKIWSLAATYARGIHSFTIAHQRSTGDIGYAYGGYRNAGGTGDGGNTIYLANSYWSDFNGKDERSWQLGYGIDLGGLLLPGLTYHTAYVRGTNIDDGTGRGAGQEREIFSQLKYVVQSGPAKNLSVRLRNSFLRVSDNASAYNSEGNETRVFVDYPISIF